TLGQHAEALATWRDCLALRRPLATGDATNAHWNDELASDLASSGLERIAAGDRPGGLDALHEAVALRARITAAAPDFLDNRLHGARLLGALGHALLPASGRPGPEACDWLARSVRAYA